MKLPIVFQPEAQEEYDGSFDWYESEKEGLGVDFTEHVQDTLDRISANPLMHQKVYRQIRRAVVAEYPFNIYYRVESTAVVVVTVFHTSRNPAVWKSRTKK